MYKKINKNIFNFVLFLIVFIVVLELSARIDDKLKYNAPFFKKYTYANLYSKDEYGLRRNNPNTQFEKWKINSFGFRGPEINLKKRKGTKRIICMGASETFGLYENENKEWPAQLSAKINDKFEVINTSIVGMGLNTFKKYYDRYVAFLKPDIIIFYIIPSFKYEPSIQNNNDLAPDKNKTVPIDKVSHTKQLFTSVKTYTKLAINSLRILPKIKIVIKTIIPKPFLKKYQLWSMRKQRIIIEKKTLKGTPPLDRLPLTAINSFEKDLTNHIKSFQNYNIVLVTFPTLINKNNIEKYPEIFEDYRRFNPQLSFDGLINASKQINASIKKIAGEKKINIIDLESIVPKEIIFFGDNVHFTTKGSEIISTSIAKFLKSEPFGLYDSQNKEWPAQLSDKLEE